MTSINELKGILGQTFDWHKARLDCFAKCLLALLAVRTVNLSEIAVAFSSKATRLSCHKRLKRFFAEIDIDLTVLARWLFSLFFSNNDKVYVIIDRTNWYWGKAKINVFMLSVAYEGLAIPLFWSLLPKAGNSNFSEQKSLLSRFVKAFGKTCIQGVLADREFASGQLFAWLNKERIPFYIRIKDNANIAIKKNKTGFTAKKLFNHLELKQADTYVNYVQIYGQRVRLAGSRSERGELMIVATNQAPDNAIAIYLRRWEIENLFQNLKGRGFRFEETRITKPERLENLIAVLAVAFCWVHKIGEWYDKKKPIQWIQIKHEKRPQFSYFSYGLSLCRQHLFSFNTHYKKNRFRAFIKLLIPQPEIIS